MTKQTQFVDRRFALFALFVWIGPTAVTASELLDAVMAKDLAGVTAALAAGADVHEPGPSAMTALHMAASRGADDIALLLINAGADVDAVAGTGQSLVHPLHLATQFHYPAVVSLLLAHGAAVDATNSRGQTPLWLAAESGYADIAEQLLEGGADPLLGDDRFSDSPIYVAAMHGYLDVVKLMVSKGVDVNYQNPRTGETPLWVAAMDSRVEVLEFLLSEGADPNIANGKGEKPIQMSSNPLVQNLLRQSGASE